MKKKILAIVLALISVFGTVVLTAGAENMDGALAEGNSEVATEVVTETETEPAPAFTQWKIGDVIPVGGAIRSLAGASMLDVYYSANIGEDAGFKITSKLGASQFHDAVSDLNGDLYKGAYKTKDLGDDVLMYFDSKTFTWENVAPGSKTDKDDTWVTEALRVFLPKDVTIDFDVDDGTILGFTELVGWEVLDITDEAGGMIIKLNAKFEKREANWFENILEIVLTTILETIDKISDYFSSAVPNFLLSWARRIGYPG